MNRPIVKYALLQMPGQIIFGLVVWLVKDWLSMPLGLVILLILLWVAKDVAMYPFVRHAYGPTDSDRAQSLIGLKGRVKERLDPSGYVELKGELWRAETRRKNGPIEAGTQVEVKDRAGLTLIVEQAGDKS